MDFYVSRGDLILLESRLLDTNFCPSSFLTIVLDYEIAKTERFTSPLRRVKNFYFLHKFSQIIYYTQSPQAFIIIDFNY